MSEIKKMYIRGEWVEAESGETLEVFNPATGECVGVVSYGDERDAKKAIDAAHEAFKEWSRLPGRQRSKYLTKLYGLVMKHRNELAELMSAEMGKPFGEAKFEAVGSADNFLWYAEEAKRIYGETIPSYDGNKRLMAIKQPVGVVAAITPWNFPVNMVARKIAPALAAGCTVVLKPAMESPLSAVRLFELMEEAGFPKGVVNLVLARRKSLAMKCCKTGKWRKSPSPVRPPSASI